VPFFFVDAMKIGVVGCGALGSFYGARLWRAGEDVHLLLRSDYEVVRRTGVHIQSFDGDFVARPQCANRPETIGPCDLVLVALKTTANDQLAQLLPPLVDRDTAVLTLQNGLGNEAALSAVAGPERVMGGLCFVCLNRIAPGQILHTAHGYIVMGEYQRSAGPRLHRVQAAFERAQLRCHATDDLERAHWEKLIWNVPFNGLGVAAIAGFDAFEHGRIPENSNEGDCLPTDRLLADPRWESLVRELMFEVVSIARALGYDLDPALVERNLERTRVMGSYKASSLIDFERGMPIELDSLFREPLRHARGAAVHTPRLAALCSVLEGLAARAKPASDKANPQTSPDNPAASTGS
jgi:2-dehydropantoate 2-reductase